MVLERATGDNERGARIRQIWHAAWGNPQRRKPLDTLGFQDVSTLVGMVALLILTILHFELLAPDGDLPVTVSGAVLIVLALFLPIQSWATVAYLEARRRGEGRIFPVWRVLAFLGGCVPLFGLYAWPIWRGLAIQNQERETGERFLPLRAPGNLPAVWQRRTGRVSAHLSLLPVLGLIVSVLLLPIAWALWMTAGETLPPDRRFRLVLLCAVFHLVSAVCIPYGLREARRRVDPGSGQGLFLRWLPLFLLLGLPGAALGMMVLFYFHEVVASRLLIPAAFQKRAGLRQGPIWTGLEVAFLQQRARRAGRRRPWVRLLRLPSEPKASQAEDRQTLFLHLKSALSFLSAAVVAWWLLHHGDGQGFWPAVYLLSAMAGLGLLLELVLICTRLLGENALSSFLARRPYGFFLLAPNSVALIGLIVGAGLASEEVTEIGRQLFTIAPGLSLILALTAVLRGGIRRDRVEGRDYLFWMGFMFVTAGMAIFMLSVQDPAPYRSQALALVIVAELGLGLVFGGWLLRPFGWRQILDRSLPPGLRWTLALLGTSALIPLGGLAIPFWIFVRQRWWPAWEKSYWRPVIPEPFSPSSSGSLSRWA